MTSVAPMKKNILIIDDNPDTLEILRLVFQGEGYTVETASDGETGLEKAMEGKAGIVLLDMMLPKMNGIELCRRLKEDEATRRVPIIIITAKSDFEARQGAIASGADAYLLKPFDPIEMVERVKKMLENRPSASP